MNIARLRHAIEQYAVLAKRDGPDSIYHALHDSAKDRLLQALDDVRAAAPSTVDRHNVSHATHVIIGDHDPERRDAVPEPTEFPDASWVRGLRGDPQ